MGERGFTLIEMMISAALAVVMGVAGYTFYGNTIQFQALHARQKEMDTRLQIAMSLLVKEIQQAGYGVNDPTLTGVGGCLRTFQVMRDIAFCPAIASVNNVANGTSTSTSTSNTAFDNQGTDTLTLLRQGISIGTLSAPAVGGATQIGVTLNPGLPRGKFIQMITIGGLSAYTLRDGPFEITNSTPSPLTLSLSSGIKLSELQNYTIGFPVEAIVTATALTDPNNKLVPALFQYSIGSNPNNTGQPALLKNNALIASGIEDLQVDLSVSGQVTIGLMARALDPNPEWSGGKRPLLGDHGAAAIPDRFRRATLTRVVELRNN